MKRSSWDGQIVVYRYGCPAKADFDQAALAQVRLAHDLRNELVAIYRRHEEEVANAWLTRPDVAEISADAAHKEECLQLVLESVRASKVLNRSQAVPAELREEAAKARRKLRETKEALRLAKGSAFTELRPVFAALSEQTRAARKATYADWVQRDGLYWATYNDVVFHFDATIKAISRLRQEGRPADVRFHRFDGTGTLTVQLQREARDGPRAPQVLASSASKWRNVIRLPGLPEDWERMARCDRRRASQVTVSIRVGRTETGRPQWLEVPTILHRPIPPNADIVQVQVTRSRIAGHYRLALAITCRLPAVAGSSIGRPSVAIDVGWRSLGDGSIRVATLEATASTIPVDVPRHLRDVIRFRSGGRQGEVILPASWTAQFVQVNHLAGLRAKNLEVLRPQLLEWLADHPTLCDSLDVDMSTIAKWRSPSQFAGLAWRWRNLQVDGDSEGEMFDALESWRRRDRYFWEWQEHQRRQILDRRRDAWRVLGALVADRYGTIVVGDMDIASISRVPTVETGDDQRDILARAQRVLAAPGSLRQAVVNAAERRGIRVVAVDSRGLSAVHHRCGRDLSRVVDFGAGVWVKCPHCQETFDQDENACRRLLGQVEAAGLPDDIRAGTGSCEEMPSLVYVEDS